MAMSPGFSMQQYHRLLSPRARSRQIQGPTAPAPAPTRFSARRNGLICANPSRYSPPRNCTSASIIHELLWFFAGRYQCPLSAGKQGHHLGRMGRTKMATSAASTARSGGTGASPTEASLDQITQVIADIKRNPDSRLPHRVSAWNPGRDRPRWRWLPLPCAFPVLRAGGRVELPTLPAQCRSVPRSTFQCGLPMRCSPSMVAQVCGLKPGEFIHTFRRLCTCYANHLDQAREQLTPRTSGLFRGCS